ncbi:hypothetical protein Sste5346_008054 [Sporothrix stenoceras]|uniref:Uncharacterized protein n=1 Tax=Sporothrix stenoceras TaxID=5173 RepID=A0ABR3YS09_9PEZI
MSDGQGQSSTATPSISTPSASTSSSSSSPFACTVCRKTYKRREHLQRHVLSHAPVPPHRCSICGNCYRRPDVLKRHFATCQARASGGSLSSLKRRACDRCVQSKKGCSTGQPCTNCQAKGVLCEYSFARDGLESSSMDTFWAEDDTSHVEDDTVNDANDSIQNDDSTDGGGHPSTADAAGDGHLGFVVVDNPINDTSTTNIANTTLNADCEMQPVPTMMELNRPSPFAYLDSNATDFILDSNNQVRVQNASWLDFLNLTNEGHQTLTTADDDEQNQLLNSYTFHFLDNFTKKTGLVTFDCGTPLQAKQVVDSLRLMGDANVSAGLLPNTAIVTNVNGDPRLSLDSTYSFPLQPSPFQDPLIVKTHQILFRIREVATVKPRNSTVTLDWSTALEQQCLHFFSPPNLHKFLALYWARWHPNVNIVHRPTFDPVDSKCVLVVAMALIGACMDADDNKQASMWFNCVEEIVFIDDDFCSPPQGDPQNAGLNGGPFDPVTNKRKIQALQASYIVCLYQNWEGTNESKQRIRRYRFSTVVSVARDIGIGSARHVDYGAATFHAFHWKAFVAREQLIRTFLWIYLLDQAFVIFNNLPPRVMIKEMVMHMAWPESTFQATTAADCAREAQLWLRRSAPLHNVTLREVVESFCSGVIVPDICRTFADLGPLNLFCIVSAFHFLIFQKQNSFGGEDQLHAIRTGLANWKNVWEMYKREFSAGPPHTMVPVPPLGEDDTTAPDDMWRRTGFMRNSPEYWLLAHLVIDRLSSQTQARPLHSAIYSHLHSGPQTVDNTAQNPILAKYDETSMRQVNDLISQFRNVQLM